LSGSVPDPAWVCRGESLGRSVGGADPRAPAWTGWGSVALGGQLAPEQEALAPRLDLPQPRLDSWAIYPLGAFESRLGPWLDRFAVATGRSLAMPAPPGDGCGFVACGGKAFSMSLFAGPRLRAEMGRYLDMVLATARQRFTFRFRFDGFLPDGAPDAPDGRFAIADFLAGRPWISRPGDRAQLTLTPKG